MASLRISDHALVRWLGRSGALDVEAVRAALAGSLERAVTAAAALGVAEFNVLAGGLVYVVRDGVVITVLPDAGPRQGRRRRRAPRGRGA